MKLLSPILLGLGLLGAATASDSTNNLRANISARQLSSSGSDSESWIYFLFLNGLNAVGDIRGGPNSCCCNKSLDRCHHPHLPCPPPAKKHCSSGGGGSGSGGSGGSGGGGGGSQATSDSDGSSASSSSSNYSNNGDDSNSNYDKSANDDYSGENDDGNNQANYYNNNDDGANGGNNQGNDDGSGSGEDQYLYNEYNGGNGNVNQITGGKSISVWPIIIAAIAIGAVAAALVATKKRKRSEQPDHVLNGSVRKRMELFRGGMFRKEQTTASSALCENGYVNES